MSQRGGTVVTTVRFGDEVLSPSVPAGEADFLVAFERLEAARHLDLVRDGGVAVVNDQRIAPSIEALKSAAYPGEIGVRAAERNVSVLVYPALRLAQELGNEKLASTILLGGLSDFLFLERDHWIRAIRASVPPHTVEANEVAFDTGAEWLVGPPTFSF